jgi:TRAP-type C4-dicarboxylate transport system permease small subunit
VNGKGWCPSLPVFLYGSGLDQDGELPMKGFLNGVHRLSRFLNIIAGISITFLMLLTVADVILRFFRIPVVGTYELVAFSGAVVIGFALPFTSWVRGHIYVDFFVFKFSQKIRSVFNTFTRCLGIWLFLMIGWNLIKYGMDLQRSGEVSLTLQLPFYPVAYGLGVCCFIQCLVLLCDIVKVFGRAYE